MNDSVNSPKHYTHGKWEVIEVLEEFFGEDPLLWQVGKYVMRYEHKENPIQDLEKAKWYLERKINKLKEQKHG
jgi:chaperonin cofactor prefoldin